MKRVLRLILLLVQILLFMIMGATLLNAYIPPKLFVGFNFLSLAFPIVVILYSLICFFWIATWRKRGLVTLFLLILFLLPIERWGNYSPNTNPKGIKIITYNTKQDNKSHKENIIAFLEKENPDIVLLQESNMKENIDALPYHFHSGLVSIYSRYKIIGSGKVMDFNDNSFSAYADLRIRGKIVRVLSVYLSPFNLEKDMVKPTGDLAQNEQKAQSLAGMLAPNFKKHQYQVEQIKNFVEQSPYPVIIGGDFNSVPNSYEYYHIAKGMKDSFLEVGNGLGTSFHDFKFPIRIDYLFCSKSITPSFFKTDRTVHLSDHFPIIGYFDIP
ncbi:endonuclease/exonuclease/phosphatase family protein [Riemerella columbipharyngis]|nr:endonuclease/exonuclease/phosphatase family protein [Riemerella columbipharyngis]